MGLQRGAFWLFWRFLPIVQWQEKVICIHWFLWTDTSCLSGFSVSAWPETSKSAEVPGKRNFALPDITIYFRVKQQKKYWNLTDNRKLSIAKWFRLKMAVWYPAASYGVWPGFFLTSPPQGAGDLVYAPLRSLLSEHPPDVQQPLRQSPNASKPALGSLLRRNK